MISWITLISPEIGQTKARKDLSCSRDMSIEIYLHRYHSTNQMNVFNGGCCHEPRGGNCRISYETIGVNQQRELAVWSTKERWSHNCVFSRYLTALYSIRDGLCCACQASLLNAHRGRGWESLFVAFAEFGCGVRAGIGYPICYRCRAYVSSITFKFQTNLRGWINANKIISIWDTT